MTEWCIETESLVADSGSLFITKSDDHPIAGCDVTLEGDVDAIFSGIEAGGRVNDFLSKNGLETRINKLEFGRVTRKEVTTIEKQCKEKGIVTCNYLD